MAAVSCEVLAELQEAGLMHHYHVCMTADQKRYALVFDGIYSLIQPILPG
jgi:hypothetical protein